MATKPESIAMAFLDEEIARAADLIGELDGKLKKLQADRADHVADLDALQRERAIIAAALGGAPEPTTPAIVKPFAVAYPAPWRLSGCGQEIQDRDGNHVTDADLDDPDEREFWRGIVDAVNAQSTKGRADG